MCCNQYYICCSINIEMMKENNPKSYDIYIMLPVSRRSAYGHIWRLPCYDVYLESFAFGILNNYNKISHIVYLSMAPRSSVRVNQRDQSVSHTCFSKCWLSNRRFEKIQGKLQHYTEESSCQFEFELTGENRKYCNQDRNRLQTLISDIIIPFFKWIDLDCLAFKNIGLKFVSIEHYVTSWPKIAS